MHSQGIFKILVFLIGLLSADGVFAKEIALSFDDAPRASSALSGEKRAKLLVEALRSSGVQQVAFFANSDKLSEEGVERLKFYSQQGHLIGNHTHSHPELNKIDTQKFIEDILIAHKRLEILPGFVKWFRFPYLREGDTIKKRDSVRQ